MKTAIDGERIKRRRISHQTMAFIFRIAAFLAGALPPSIRALMLFPVWREERVIRIRAGFGAGVVIAILICVFVFRKTILATVKRNVGVLPLLVSLTFYMVFLGLRKMGPYIPRLEEVAFWAILGCLLSWVFSALAYHFRMKGGSCNGNADP